MWHDMGWGGGWIGWLFWIIILVIIVFAVIRLTGSRQKPPTVDEIPLDILKKRYAKGEITKGQYEQMKKDLE